MLLLLQQYIFCERLREIDLTKPKRWCQIVVCILLHVFSQVRISQLCIFDSQSSTVNRLYFCWPTCGWRARLWQGWNCDSFSLWILKPTSPYWRYQWDSCPSADSGSSDSSWNAFIRQRGGMGEETRSSSNPESPSLDTSLCFLCRAVCRGGVSLLLQNVSQTESSFLNDTMSTCPSVFRAFVYELLTVLDAPWRVVPLSDVTFPGVVPALGSRLSSVAQATGAQSHHPMLVLMNKPLQCGNSSSCSF